MQSPQVYGYINDICLIGHGAIGQTTLPLIKKHFKFDRITIIDPHPVMEPIVEQNVTYLKVGLTNDNFRQILDKIFISSVGFCVNLSTGVSSCEVMLYCQQKKVLYIDTVKQPWEGEYGNQDVELEKRTNYAFRELMWEKVRKNQSKTTAISCCGANPGMVSWLVKQALINLVKDTNYPMKEQPQNRKQWAELMRDLGVKGVHIAERDTQVTNSARPIKQFWNTWSVDGFLSEGFYQAAELGWGTHEKWAPKSTKYHKQGCGAAIYLTQPGMNTRVKTWCPTYGPQFGFLVTHDEAISIADYFTVRDENGKATYRPTSHYAYHPCPDAVASSLESIGSGEFPTTWKILGPEITSGMDELGVLLYGHSKNAYWYGSQLDINTARERANGQSATTLQVTSAVIAGMTWAMQNPESGFVQPDYMDYKRCLQIQNPYAGPFNGYYTNWTPLDNKRNQLNDDDFDLEDPWQFKNIIMNK